MENKAIFMVVDLIASEYGWTMDYILDLPHDVLNALHETIIARQKRDIEYKTRLMSAAVNCGFSGENKILDKIFKLEDDGEMSEEDWKIQTKALWMKMKAKNKTAEEFKSLEDEFEERWKAGTIEF